MHIQVFCFTLSKDRIESFNFWLILDLVNVFKFKPSVKSQDNLEKPVGITLPNSKCPPQVSQASTQPVDQTENKESWVTKLALANEEHVRNQEKHYRKVIETAKKSIENLSFANPRKLPPISTNFTHNRNHPQAAPHHDFNRMPYNNFRSILGAPAGLPVYFGAMMPQPNVLFPPNNNPSLLQFGQVHPVPPVLPAVALPPGGPYHQQSLLGQPPISPIYFPWNQQNTYAPFSVDNVRERP